MKRIVLAITFLVLASVGCLQPALPTLPPASSQTPAPLPTLTPQNPSTPVSKLFEKTPRVCLVVTADQTLNVRQAATVHSPSIAFLRNGQRVYALGSIGNWWQLKEGYIHSDYVEECDHVQSQTISKRR